MYSPSLVVSKLLSISILSVISNPNAIALAPSSLYSWFKLRVIVFSPLISNLSFLDKTRIETYPIRNPNTKNKIKQIYIIRRC